MSEFKTNKISPRSGTTQTIGDSGDSVSTSGGSTITNAGSISTAGITGGTINNTTGEIYLRGEVDWKPGDIKTASFTATDNQGFFVNTTSGQITVTLPASPSAGDVVGIKDYANTFDTNKCILNANGNKIQGSTTLFEITVEGSSIIIIYVDSTKGWVITDASKAADISQAALFTVATGGTITESGDFKIHTFTSPGTFTVTQLGNGPTVPTGGPTNVDYLVVAGGAGGGTNQGGGGGAGGFRESHLIATSGCYTASPLATPTSLPVSATGYPITVGAGGSTGPNCNGDSNPGSNSVFSTITSAGGGGAGASPFTPPSNGFAQAGGSGGGTLGGPNTPFGPRPGGAAGNTPPVSPPQGNPGGDGAFSACNAASGGGGGATASGTSASAPGTSAGNGGNGATTSISASPTTYSGGGGGAVADPDGTSYPTGGGTGGTGGGGSGGSWGTNGIVNAVAGTTNSGGGGGGGTCNQAGKTGGSGIIIIRYKFQ